VFLALYKALIFFSILYGFVLNVAAPIAFSGSPDNTMYCSWS